MGAKMEKIEMEAIDNMKSLFSLLIEEIKSVKEDKNKLPIQRLLNTEEAMKILGIKKSKLYDMVSRQELPHIKIAGKIMFDSTDLKKFIESNKKEKFRYDFSAGDLKGNKYNKKR
jgi:excisionase family DNA binding protein